MMIIAGAVLLCGVLAAVPAYLAICCKLRPERMTLIVLLLNGLLYYGFCAAHLADAGFFIIVAGNLSFFAPVLCALRRDRNIWQRYWTPAMAVYFLVVFALLALTCQQKFFMWDDFSHWGFSAKLLFETGKLNCEFGTVLEHASYPPGLSLLRVFIHKCVDFRCFRESAVIFANWVLILTAALSLADAWQVAPDRKMHKYHSAAGMMIVFVALLCMWGAKMFTGYTEPLLVTLAAVTYFRVFTGESVWRDDVEVLLLSSWLILLKAAGVGIAALAIVFYLIRVWLDRRSRRSLPAKIMPLAVCLVLLFAYVSWVLLLDCFQTPIVFAPRVSWREAVKMLCAGEVDYAADIFTGMVERFGSDAEIIAVFAVVVCCGVWYWFCGSKKGVNRKLVYTFMPVFLAVMTVSLFMTYAFVFNRGQAEQLVSFTRYMVTFAGILLLLQIFLLLREHAWQMAGGKKSLAATVGIVLIFAALYYKEARAIPYRNDVRWRCEADASQKLYGDKLRQVTAFTVLSRSGNGQKQFIYKYLYPQQFVPAKWYDPQLASEMQGSVAIFSAEQLHRCLASSVQYVLLDGMDAGFFAAYPDLFALPPADQPCALYQLTADGKFKYIPPRHSVGR